MSIVHSFTSAISDGVDDTLVRPSDWNDDHVLNGIRRHLITSVGTTGYSIYHNLNSTYSCLIGWSTTWNTSVFVNYLGATHMDVVFSAPSTTPSDIFISNVEIIS